MEIKELDAIMFKAELSAMQSKLKEDERFVNDYESKLVLNYVSRLLKALDELFKHQEIED